MEEPVLPLASIFNVQLTYRFESSSANQRAFGPSGHCQGREHAMLKLISAAAIVGLATHLAAAPAFAAGSCRIAMSKLMGEWQDAGFLPRQSPAQHRVLGNDGRVASGPQIGYMRSQISFAARECARGENALALTRIAKVNDMLHG
jgi:hypothetical protein